VDGGPGQGDNNCWTHHIFSGKVRWKTVWRLVVKLGPTQQFFLFIKPLQLVYYQNASYHLKMCFQIITVFLIIVATSSFLFYLLKNKKIVVRSGSKMFAFERNLRDDERLVKRKTRPTPGTKHPKRGKWKKTKSSTKQKYVTKQKTLMASIFDYLLEGFKNFLNYAYARSTKKELVIPTIQFIAMDCEMVGYGKNGSKSLLARCSLVTLSETEPMNLLDHDTDETRLQIEVLYDVYVKPTKNVTDYRTQYSGITKEHLWRDDAVSWDVCHSHVKKVLKSTEDKRVVLIGHGLENDFQVLNYWVSLQYILYINLSFSILC
jgi:hypothetical protein